MISKIYKLILAVPEIFFPILVFLISFLAMFTPMTGDFISMPIGFWVYLSFLTPVYYFFQFLGKYISIPSIDDMSNQGIYMIIFYAFVGLIFRLVRMFIKSRLKY